MEILDLKCAEFGYKIGQSASEDIIRKSLGVLQEDGVYAFFLWCASKAVKIQEESFNFLKEEVIMKNILQDEVEPLQAIRNKLKDNLDHLLFAKELLERTLVYAR